MEHVGPNVGEGLGPPKFEPRGYVLFQHKPCTAGPRVQLRVPNTERSTYFVVQVNLRIIYLHDGFR